MIFKKSQNEIKQIVIYGIVAAFFFSSTFAINRWLNVQEGGHWYWTATLRYIYVSVFLSLYILFYKGWKNLKETFNCFLSYWLFWIIAGGIGFGMFYLFLCYAASYSPGWVLATTWQLTILMTPFVIVLLGNRVPRQGIFYLIIIFIGILLVNYHEFSNITMISLKSIIPISLAAFCYPLGNTLCKYACEGKYPKVQVYKFEVSQEVFNQVLLMALGSLPVLICVGVFVSPPPPTFSQIYSIAFVALSTGVIATGLLYKARNMAKRNTFALSAADGTQAAEAPLALFWEWSLFGVILPLGVGVIGLVLVITGVLLFYRSNVNIDSVTEN